MRPLFHTALASALLIAVPPAIADTVVAKQTVRSRSIVTAASLALAPGDTYGALARLEDAIGLEARVVLYAGRPIRPEDLGPPALIDRNQIVPLVFSMAGLAISTEGRSLSRAAAGERVRVMNLTSRTTVSGIVGADGRIFVDGSTPPTNQTKEH